MNEPKNIDDLDKIIDQQKKQRELEYQTTKWLFFANPRLPWGIVTFFDLIKKDKRFWLLSFISFFLLMFFDVSLFFLIDERIFWFIIIIQVIFGYIFSLIVKAVFYGRMKKSFPKDKSLFAKALSFPFDFKLIAIVRLTSVVLLGLFLWYLFNKI